MEDNKSSSSNEDALAQRSLKDLLEIIETLIHTLKYSSSECELAYLSSIVQSYISENKTKSIHLFMFIQQTAKAIRTKLNKNPRKRKKEAIAISPDLRINISSAAVLVKASEEEAKIDNKSILETKAQDLIHAIQEKDTKLNSREIYSNLSKLGQLILDSQKGKDIKIKQQTEYHTKAIKLSLEQVRSKHDGEVIIRTPAQNKSPTNLEDAHEHIMRTFRAEAQNPAVELYCPLPRPNENPAEKTKTLMANLSMAPKKSNSYIGKKSPTTTLRIK